MLQQHWSHCVRLYVQHHTNVDMGGCNVCWCVALWWRWCWSVSIWLSMSQSSPCGSDMLNSLCCICVSFVSICIHNFIAVLSDDIVKSWLYCVLVPLMCTCIVSSWIKWCYVMMCGVQVVRLCLCSALQVEFSVSCKIDTCSCTTDTHTQNFIQTSYTLTFICLYNFKTCACTAVCPSINSY